MSTHFTNSNQPSDVFLRMGVVYQDERGVYGSPVYDPKIAAEYTQRPEVQRTGEVCVHTNSLPSHFALITGSTGSGKTSLGRHLINQWLHLGVPVISFDLHGDLQVNPNQPVVKLGKHGTASIRPLLPAREILQKQGLESYRELTVNAFFPRELGGSQLQLYRRMFDGFMAENGVSNDVTSTAEINIDSLLVSNFCSYIKEKTKKEDTAERKVADSILKYLEGLISPALEGDDFVQVADIINLGARIDFSGLPEREKKVMANLVLKLILAEIMAQNNKLSQPLPRVMLYIDEAKVVIDQNDPDNTTIAGLMAEGRKYGIGAILATQQVASFGNDICDNASMAISLSCNSRSEASRIQRRLGFPRDQVLRQPMGGGCIRWGVLEAHRVGFYTLPQNLDFQEITLQDTIEQALRRQAS